MATAVANPRFPANDPGLKKFLVYSLALHGALATALLLGAYLNLLGNQWAGVGGSSGDNVRVNLVSSAGIPMPKPNLPAESQVVDPAQTLHNVEPPKIDNSPDKLKIPEFKREHVLPPSPKSKPFENKTPPPPNAIVGHGQPKLPTGYQDTPGAPASGTAMAGQAGGDFATRYGWYIAAARRRVAPNWDRLSIDPNVRNSTTLHCAVSFIIERNGTVKDVRLTESSGNLSWDNAGVRAILNSSPLPPLPSDYSHQEVSVTWDFPEKTQ